MPPAKRVRVGIAVQSAIATARPAIENAATGEELDEIVADSLESISPEDPSIVLFYAELIQAVASKQDISFDLFPSLDSLLENLPQVERDGSAGCQEDEGREDTASSISFKPLKKVLKAHRTLHCCNKNANEVYALLHKAAEWLLGHCCLGADDAINFDLLRMASHNLELTKLLLVHGANPNPKPDGRGGALIQDVALGGGDDLQGVLKLLAPHYGRENELGPALVESCEECYCCNSQTIRTLVEECAADVNYVRPRDGATALLLATGHRYEGCVETLILGGAKPVPDRKGVTPLMRAAGVFHEDGLEVDLLLKAGDRVNARDEEGRTALQYVFEETSISSNGLLRSLIEGGAHGNSSPGCGLLQRIFEGIEGDDDFDDEEVELHSHRMHILLLRATLPVFDLRSDEYGCLEELEQDLGHDMASTCLSVHQAHFRHARAVFVAARSCTQLVRSRFCGVDSPVALALVRAYSSEERAAARDNPMTAIHRPRKDVRFDHVRNEGNLRKHSNSQGCEDLLNIDDPAERVAKFAFDLRKTCALPENERNQCGINVAVWYTYLDIPLSVGVSS